MLEELVERARLRKQKLRVLEELVERARLRKQKLRVLDELCERARLREQKASMLAELCERGRLRKQKARVLEQLVQRVSRGRDVGAGRVGTDRRDGAGTLTSGGNVDAELVRKWSASTVELERHWMLLEHEQLNELEEGKWMDDEGVVEKGAEEVGQDASTAPCCRGAVEGVPGAATVYHWRPPTPMKTSEVVRMGGLNLDLSAAKALGGGLAGGGLSTLPSTRAEDSAQPTPREPEKRSPSPESARLYAAGRCWGESPRLGAAGRWIKHPLPLQRSDSNKIKYAYVWEDSAEALVDSAEALVDRWEDSARAAEDSTQPTPRGCAPPAPRPAPKPPVVVDPKPGAPTDGPSPVGTADSKTGRPTVPKLHLPKGAGASHSTTETSSSATNTLLTRVKGAAMVSASVEQFRAALGDRAPKPPVVVAPKCESKEEFLLRAGREAADPLPATAPVPAVRSDLGENFAKPSWVTERDTAFRSANQVSKQRGTAIARQIMVGVL